MDIVSIAVDQLGKCIGSLSESGQVIADALDEVFSRAWN